MGGAYINIGFRCHAGMADAVRALKRAEPILFGDPDGITEILDQFECAAEGEHFRPLDLLDLGC